MKRVYWRPKKVSRKGLLAVGFVAVIGLVLVQRSPIRPVDNYRDVKWQAATQAAAMFESLRQERLRREIPIEAALDPMGSGLIGTTMSAVTSRPSDLRSKQTSVNPNFAAAIVDMLIEAGVQPGDTVAVGWSGSFPAFNTCVCAALDRLQVRPVIIASALSSQYGANLSDFMWLDMETHLRQQGLTHCRSAAVSYGGAADRGVGQPAEALAHLDAVAQRNEIPALQTNQRAEAVRRRMKLYRHLAGDAPIRAYINVGGGVASTGGEQGKHLFAPGLNLRFRRGAAEVESTMGEFARAGIPVIHLNQAKRLAELLDFPVAPVQPAKLGVGRPFDPVRPNRWLAGLVIVTLLWAMRLCVWSGAGYQSVSRLMHQLRAGTRSARSQACEPASEPQLMI